jgi:hypothetical protein
MMTKRTNQTPMLGGIYRNAEDPYYLMKVVAIDDDGEGHAWVRNARCPNQSPHLVNRAWFRHWERLR